MHNVEMDPSLKPASSPRSNSPSLIVTTRGDVLVENSPDSHDGAEDELGALKTQGTTGLGLNTPQGTRQQRRLTQLSTKATGQ